jgi:Family of unknown function (DUF6527)
MRLAKISHQVVEFIPEQLEEGVLYISERYGTAAHKCCCGCGEEVVTPLTPTDWSLRIDGATVTLHPSVGNWSYACQSHYWIRKGKVVWAGQMSRQQIELGRTRDRTNKQVYFEAVNRQKTTNPERMLNKNKTDTESQSWLRKLWLSIKFGR